VVHHIDNQANNATDERGWPAGTVAHVAWAAQALGPDFAERTNAAS